MEESQVINALTVDVEDYFHVSAFADVIDRDSWTSETPLLRDLGRCVPRVPLDTAERSSVRAEVSYEASPDKRAANGLGSASK